MHNSACRVQSFKLRSQALFVFPRVFLASLSLVLSQAQAGQRTSKDHRLSELRTNRTNTHCISLWCPWSRDHLRIIDLGLSRLWSMYANSVVLDQSNMTTYIHVSIYDYIETAESDSHISILYTAHISYIKHHQTIDLPKAWCTWMMSHSAKHF